MAESSSSTEPLSSATWAFSLRLAKTSVLEGKGAVATEDEDEAQDDDNEDRAEAEPDEVSDEDDDDEVALAVKCPKATVADDADILTDVSLNHALMSQSS